VSDGRQPPPDAIDQSALAALPIFPLPDVVLFPGALLPLHVFEPRYRELTRRALEGEGLIAMALLEPGHEEEYFGNPPIRPVVGVGRIVDHRRLEDGRYTLVLLGVARARILEVVSADPFRTARVELLPDRPAEGEAYERRRRLLLNFYGDRLRELAEQGAPVPLPPPDIPLGPLCDLILHLVPVSAGVKQTFLEEAGVGARCDRLLRLLERLREGREDEGVPPGRRWPPEPSDN
jgi:hypothetical protein